MRSVRRCRSFTIATALTALMAVSSTGCGGSGGSAGGETKAATAEPSGAESGTVVVKHRYGSTEAPVRPERIVSLDTQWTDVLLAMDAPPVGYLLDSNVTGGDFPWRGERLADATGMKATNALPYEQIAALTPDLIVVTFFAQDRADYEKLSAIAPTIPILSVNEVDSWQDITRAAGVVLDATDQADALIDGIADDVTEVADELPGLAGKTFALANFVPGDGIYVVADPDDGSNVLFAQLGLDIAPTILDAAGDASGRVQLSLEQTALLDADVLVLFTNGADAKELPGYARLPAVRTGAVAVLDYAEVVGLNTPTPLSVPYSLELIRPALEAASR